LKLSYFDQEKADDDDFLLKRCIIGRVVPPTCLLGGDIVFKCDCEDKDPCKGCAGPREKCKGRPG
jgi:hypothetical protein